MSAIQDLRDKIHRKNGMGFMLREIAQNDTKSYANMRKLVSLGEVIVDGIGRDAVYCASSSLKIREVAKVKSLDGLRDVYPWHFKITSKFDVYSIY